MTKERFFDAFGQIDPSYILAVEDILLSEPEHSPAFSRRQLLRTALLAAVIAALMVLTAYAAGLFGLSARLIRAPDAAPTEAVSTEAAKLLERLRTVHHRDYISLSGIAGSPEYLAAAEWLSFKGEYADQKSAEQLARGEAYYEWRDLERSFVSTAEEKETCRLYEVWDAAMWQKLQEIADKYSLTLHTKRTHVPGERNQTKVHGLYEDGSYYIGADVDLPEQLYIFEIRYERTGALPCDDMTASCTEEYEEWEYENPFGDRVSIAVRFSSDQYTGNRVTYHVFYSCDGATMTLSSDALQLPDGNADEKQAVERLVDAIDFAALASAESPEQVIKLLYDI